MKTEIIRNTSETQISLTLEYPGTEREIETGCGFLDHMLNLMCHRAGFGIVLKAKGDVEIDFHHLTEDIGIALGQALRVIAKESAPINRYAWCMLPMDGSLARVALDFSGRGGAFFKGSFPTERCADFDLELVFEFFQALAREGAITLHIGILEADNSHHAAEAIFKAVGVSLRQALLTTAIDPSTKGLWL
ncbi:MAG: imidazoleglycerol-phosphate dehydratase [Synergistaceae bacterium]|jgi:imidazoleglycerol-phosphate dehydratase|nr:imidazoleglycerol-phosphate dehydratase [Synergistaceae bacterium]